MEKNKLTNSEWEVYECLWEEAPLTLAQLRKRYVQRTGLALSTAETTVLRMEKKGLLREEQGERAKLFYPIYDREKTVRRATRSFLLRVYGGSPLSLMSAMVDAGEFSDREIDQLYAMLRKEKEKRDG